MDLNVRIAGEAGQGVQTAGNLLAQVLAHMGLHVFTTQSYMSRIRGGLNWYDVRLGDTPLFSGRERADVLVALTDAAFDLLHDRVEEGGVVIFDGRDREGAICLDFDEAAKEAGGSKVMANTIAVAAVIRVLGYEIDELCDFLADSFRKKGEEVIEKNVSCARKGAELTESRAGSVRGPEPAGAPSYCVSGAEASGLAAATGGVKVASAYPMTPGTATFAYLAGAAKKYGIVVEQAEDEIAAINMVCGAAYAGVPVLTSTSGGGFSLMVEGVSLAGMLELPVVIVIGQRPGPATGLPTRTAQQDLRLALHAGHGEFPRAIFAPGTVQQSYELTRRALEMAHKYQTPAILLTDQFLQDLQTNCEPLDDSYRPIDRCLTDAGADYERYTVTDDGVSPRAVPGGDAFVVSDSDEHHEDGHLTEDLDTHVAQTDKRMRKGDGLASEALPPRRYGPDDAETLLLCWGSTYGPCREAVDLLNADDDGRVAMLHFAQVWPLDTHATAAALKTASRVCVVEGNQTGQFASLLRQLQVLGDCEPILRYDGMPFTAEFICRKVRT